MAKEIREHYRVGFDCEVDDLGKTIAPLIKNGVKNLGYELVTDVHAFSNKAPRHNITSEDFTKEWAAEHPTFEIKELVSHFRANQRNAGAAYKAARDLVDSGFLKKLSPGNYQRSDVKALASPDKKPHGLVGKTQKHFDISGKDSIIRHIRRRGRFTAKELRILFRAQGREESSVSPLLTKMAAAKEIKLQGDGNYTVLRLPKPAKQKPIVTAADKRRARDKERHRVKRLALKKAQMNGQPSTSETANG